MASSLSPVSLPSAAGFLDLNIPISTTAHTTDDHSDHSSSSDEGRANTVATLMRLGFDGVAWNYITGDRAIPAPPTAVPLREAMERKEGSTSLSILRLSAMRPLDHTRFQQYSRLTFRLPPGSSTELTTFNSNANLNLYDIVAVEPSCNATLTAACSLLNVDIIVVNAAEKLPFRLSISLARQAIARGVFFEVAYAPALRDDTFAKRNLFSNMAHLVRLTKGKHIVLSSGAREHMHLRGPYDVINLASIFGLAPDRAKAVLFASPHQVIRHGLNRRLGLGAIQIYSSK